MIPYTLNLNDHLPYLFEDEPQYFEILAEILPDKATIALVGFGPGLMACALYEAAGYNKFFTFAIDIANFTGILHLEGLGIPFSLYPMQMSSVEAAGRIQTPLDMVIIDANHSYESVKEDIELWSSKVKSGGILYFHDYIPMESDNGVKQAVDEWRNVGWDEIASPGISMVFQRK